MLRNAQNAGQDWLDGVKNPARDPKQAALKAAGKWKNNTQKAIANDSYTKGVQGIDVAQMQATAEKIGPAGYVNGIMARQDKIAAAINVLAPKVNALSSRIQAMPQDTDQQREARMLENLKGMRALK